MITWPILTWIVGGYGYDVLYRSRVAERAARAYADSVGKPLLVVGAGTRGSSLATALGFVQRSGDIHCDIAATGPCPVPLADGPTAYANAPVLPPGADHAACYCDAHDLPWADGTFGAVLATHLLEHLDDPDAALAEWSRVGDRVFLVTPAWWAAHTWLHPGHKWYVGQATRLRLRA